MGVHIREHTSMTQTPLVIMWPVISKHVSQDEGGYKNSIVCDLA